jgi:CheY-like chemotaxis protein
MVKQSGESSNSTPKGNPMLLQGKNVFVVEDNVQNRVVFQMILRKHGASVDFERMGIDTIFRLQNSAHIDMILLDLMLAEGISGFDLFTDIREKLPNLAHVPIVAVSAMEPAIAIPKAQALGFSGFIAKPINSLIFGEQLASIFDGETVWYTGEHSAQ